MKIIDGKNLADEILAKIKSRVDILEEKPKLAIIQVGYDSSSEIYVNHKMSDAEKVGIDTELFYYEELSADKLERLVLDLNDRDDITGYIIQLPLKVDGDKKEVFELIDPNKDVDGMNPLSLGYLWQGREDATFLPATVRAVKKCLEYIAVYSNGEFNKEELDQAFIDSEFDSYVKGKNVVIVNDSVIVGRPLAALLLNKGATVTIAHKYTKNLSQVTLGADILIPATGVPSLIKAEMIKKDAVVIDVGIKKVNNFTYGDVDYQKVLERVSWITPVPNGVGPLTRAMLLENVMTAFDKRS